jgi:3-oxoacyl-[acyl-carrier-protein] synthase I
MATDDVVIAHAGVVSPVGLSLPETAASARARLARVQEIEWRDRRFEPFIVGSVPDDGLPPLVDALAALSLHYREARMVRLAHVALEETLTPLLGKAAPMPLLLGLPEQHTTQALDPKKFLSYLTMQLPEQLDIERSLAVPRGRASGLMAMRQASARLRRGDCPFVLVGGVDCLVDLSVLSTLDMQGRIRNEINSDGFSPSEGAAFLLLSLASTAKTYGLRPMAAVLGSAQGHEPGHLYSDEKYLGEGLATTFATLLAEAPPPQPIGTVYCSFNGERYWAREFGVAMLRQSRAFVAEHQMEHPAECFGDMGSAQGPTLAALAAHGMHHGYRPAPCLVFASSDYGDRAASLLGRIP